ALSSAAPPITPPPLLRRAYRLRFRLQEHRIEVGMSNCRRPLRIPCIATTENVMPRRASTVLSLLALCSALACPPADAAVMLLRVGAGAQCDYRTDVLPNALQSAIDAVPTSIPAGDAYVIRVARSGNYSGVKLDLFNRGVIIEGGYATCSSATSDSTNTEIDAAGAAAGPALDIHGGSVRR